MRASSVLAKGFIPVEEKAFEEWLNDGAPDYVTKSCFGYKEFSTRSGLGFKSGVFAILETDICLVHPDCLKK